MQCQTVTHRTQGGWSAPLPVALDSEQTLVLAFAAPELADSPGPLVELARAFPNSVILGCSTSGEIAGSEVLDVSVSVAVARFAQTRLRRAITRVEGDADSFAAGARVAAQLAHGRPDELQAVFVLCTGLRVNGTQLVDGIAAGLPRGIPITGGLAGDGSRFARTWVLDGQRPETNHVSAVGLYGSNVRVGHGCDAGWSDFGPERRITRSSGNVLYELDGKPALALYKTYLGERAAGLPGTALLFPLAVRRDEHDDDALVRTILAVDEKEQSMTFAGDLPEGGIARLMRANTDRLICSAGMAARAASAALGADTNALVISVSCVGRRLVLGQRVEEEVETVRDSVPCRGTHVGFYSYGEIAPASPGAASELHNQTMTVTVLSEA